MSSKILAVYFGNLREDLDDNRLKENILDLLKNYLDIQLTNDDIQIKKNEKDNCVYARVKLQSDLDVNKVLENLQSQENRVSLRFDFCDLVKPLVQLLVTDKDQQNLFCTLQKVPLAGKLYRLNDKIGQGTRDKEFKTGSGEYLKKDLEHHIRKYLTAFLNSNQNGTLFIGVKDDGHVEGVEIKEEEIDYWRRRIDDSVKSIIPTVLPQMYKVDFVKVLCKGNRRKVIEITVFGKDVVLETMYSSKDGVFIRRDGSVQKFTPV